MKFPCDELVPVRDSREKDEQGYFQFHYHVEKLNCGDYTVGTVDGDGELTVREDLIIVERKKTSSELAVNIGTHRKRFERQLERMSKTRYKFLVCEFTYEEYLHPERSKLNKPFLEASLIDLTMKFGIVPIFATNYEHAEDFVIRAFQRVQKQLEQGVLR